MLPVPFYLQLQGTPLDPTPWTGFGVMGLLGIVILAMSGVIWKVFATQQSILSKQNESQSLRDGVLMNFVDRQRAETTAALDKLGQVVNDGQKGMQTAFERQTRMLDEVLLTQRVLAQIKDLRQAGVPLTQTEVDMVIRSVKHERDP